MARAPKMTFTLDADTASRIDQTAHRLGIPKSAVVREAEGEYAARVGEIGVQERLRTLQPYDEVLARIPRGSVNDADAELIAFRDARRHGGRGTV